MAVDWVQRSGRWWAGIVARARLLPFDGDIAAVLLAAFTLRLHGLASESLWLDELFTVDKLYAPPWDGEIWARIRNDVHPPGHVVLAWVFATISARRSPGSASGTPSASGEFSLAPRLPCSK